MPNFSAASLAKLATCDSRLQDLFMRVVLTWDCGVADAYRDQPAQDAAVAAGKSKDPWPTSKHNRKPSVAVDVFPAPLDWSNIQRFIYFAGFVKGVAATMGIQIRWGGDFDENLNPRDDSFHDYDHFELVNF